MAVPMVRTQIFLTGDEQNALETIAGETGRTKSDLIREAVDALIERYHPTVRRDLIARAFGMWREREDLPDFAALRQEFDRRLG
jgi:Ribbon-helix-helix protein, copG family